MGPRVAGLSSGERLGALVLPLLVALLSCAIVRCVGWGWVGSEGWCWLLLRYSFREGVRGVVEGVGARNRIVVVGLGRMLFVGYVGMLGPLRLVAYGGLDVGVGFGFGMVMHGLIPVVDMVSDVVEVVDSIDTSQLGNGLDMVVWKLEMVAKHNLDIHIVVLDELEVDVVAFVACMDFVA